MSYVVHLCQASERVLASFDVLQLHQYDWRLLAGLPAFQVYVD